MSIKKILFIDDNKIDSIITKLRNSLQKEGFTLQEEILNLNDDSLKVRDANDEIVLSFDKIKDVIQEKYFNESFDLVVSDYDYADKNIDGFKLIKWFKNVTTSQKKKIRRAQFYLYSAKGDSIVEKLDNIDKIKGLVRLKLSGILDRNKLADELAIEIKKREETFAFLDIVLKELDKYSDCEFKNVFPKFKGKKLFEIAEEIDKDLPNGIAFQKTLTELTIAHLIELNNIEEKND